MKKTGTFDEARNWGCPHARAMLIDVMADTHLSAGVNRYLPPSDRKTAWHWSCKCMPESCARFQPTPLTRALDLLRVKHERRGYCGA